MTKENFKYIYGPLPSWRLGSSLGIDLLSQEAKVCNFNCIYCQLGKTPHYRKERKIYAPTDEVIKELKNLPEVKIDYITFSGRGEPTLAENLGEVIRKVKRIRKEPIAVLTNSSLMDRKDVRRELTFADFVITKLDAYTQASFREINRPSPEIGLEGILKGIKAFREGYGGRLALQIMFIEKNKIKAKELVRLIDEIKPDEIQINTPLRPSDEKPLSKEDILKIKEYFVLECRPSSGKKKPDIVSVYDERPYKEAFPISSDDTARRREKKERGLI